MDEAVAHAFGDLGEPGPSYVEIPTDVLRTHVPPQMILDDWMRPKPPRTIPPDPMNPNRTLSDISSSLTETQILGRSSAQARCFSRRYLMYGATLRPPPVMRCNSSSAVNLRPC